MLLALAAGCTAAAPAPAVRACRPVNAAAWRPVTLPGAGAAPGDLLPGPPWVAVGSVPSGDRDAPAAWESADARTWRRVPVRPVSPDGAVQKLVLAAPSGGLPRAASLRSPARSAAGRSAAALGVTYSIFEGRVRPSAWHRTGDGWEEVPAERELWGGPRAHSLTGLASGPAGLVAVGARNDAEDRQVVGAWWSRDGAAWSRPPDSPALTSGDGEIVAPTGVAVGPRGAVIVGDRVPLTASGSVDGIAWTSPDGRRWARVPAAGLPGGPGVQRLGRVAAFRDGFVAVGLEGDGDRVHQAAWTSPDGATWTAARDQVLAAGSGPTTSTAVDRLVVAGGCLLATGRVGGAPRLWTSADGSHWAALPLPPGLGGPVDGHVLVAAGASATVLGAGGRLWVAPA